MKSKAIKSVTYFVVFLITFIANAQGPPSPGGGVTPPGLPISDYLFVLVIIAVFYGVKKIKSLSTD